MTRPETCECRGDEATDKVHPSRIIIDSHIIRDFGLFIVKYRIGLDGNERDMTIESQWVRRDE